MKGRIKMSDLHNTGKSISFMDNSGKTNAGLLFMICGLLFAVFGIIFYFNVNDFDGYTLTTGTITDINSERNIKSSTKSRSYDVYIRYNVNGTSYENPISFYSADMYTGKEISIYYNNLNPNDIKVKGEVTFAIVFVIFGLIFAAMGLYLIIHPSGSSPKAITMPEPSYKKLNETERAKDEDHNIWTLQIGGKAARPQDLNEHQHVGTIINDDFDSFVSAREHSQANGHQSSSYNDKPGDYDR